MKILLIEDDERKMTHIVDYVSGIDQKYKIEVKRSYNSGLRAVLSGAYDLILLDMSLPTFDVSVQGGGRAMAFAGRELLEKVARRNLDCKFTVITQFDYFGDGDNVKSLDQLASELALEFGEIFLGVIYFSILTDDWKGRLEQVLKRVGGGDVHSIDC